MRMQRKGERERARDTVNGLDLDEHRRSVKFLYLNLAVLVKHKTSLTVQDRQHYNLLNHHIFSSQSQFLI